MRWVVTCALLAATGCQKDVSTEFPEGLEPFDDDDKPLDLDGTVAEELRTTSSDDDYIRVYGRGFIAAAPLDVWTVAHRPEVMIAVCSTTTQTVMPDNEPQYDLSFLVHYFVDDILNVEWDDQWRGDVVLGTAEAPTLSIVKHQKVQGSDFIKRSEGTIELVGTPDPAVTEIRFVEHLDAVGGGADDVVKGMRHNYNRLVSVVHGGPVTACP